MRTLQIHKDSTETFVTYPPQQRHLLYQASAADLRIRTPAEAMTAEGSEETVTVDAVSTTLSAAATRGDSTLTLTSGAAIVAHRLYLIEDGGDRFTVQIDAISGTTAYLAEPLLQGIANGAAFKGFAIYHALTAAETATSGRTGLAKFRATLNGVQHEWDQWFEVVDSIFPITLTPTRLLRRGEVRRMRDPTDGSLQDTIDAAWEDTLLRKLRAAGILEETINTPTEIESAHIEACILHLMRGSDTDDETVAIQEQRLEKVIAEVKASVKMRIDITEDDANPTDERQHLAEYEVPRLGR